MSLLVESNFELNFERAKVELEVCLDQLLWFLMRLLFQMSLCQDLFAYPDRKSVV